MAAIRFHLVDRSGVGMQADTLFALVAWELWKERNARCFRNATSTVGQVLSTIKQAANQWIDTGACKLGCLVRE
jgi:hypothetical protein